jgi:hypothetical protein
MSLALSMRLKTASKFLKFIWGNCVTACFKDVLALEQNDQIQIKAKKTPTEEKLFSATNLD